MSSICHQMDILFGPIAGSDHLEIDCRSDDSSALASSRGLPARAHSNGVCVGALFALKHRNERLAAVASPSSDGQKFVVKGRPFGGGSSPECEDRSARPEPCKARKTPVHALFNFERTPPLEPPVARGLAPPLAVRQAQGMTKGQEVIQQARARNSQPRQLGAKKERAGS